MSDESEQTFSLEEGLAVQQRLRTALELPPEQFPLPAFIGMISDEIEQMRARGRSDADIAAMIKETIGREVSPENIDRFYATPDQRQGHG